MTITASIEPPGYHDPNVKTILDIGHVPVMAFYGGCMGVALIKSDPTSLHLTFITLVEDDGWWRKYSGGVTDTYWLPELLEALQEAHRWIKAYGRKSKDGIGWDAKK